ncbi:hypothetical protein [Vagococcus carniphilus]|uniref:hypothetical protein n=1 Tax=Vagococcus carniphilus TaxID=218144 RepID=UPI00288C891A|nr:hypothetical protein [Vagococcus carniphilus]MDT2864344.1 hypothetical protein [Vagococcus carniphilus]
MMKFWENNKLSIVISSLFIISASVFFCLNNPNFVSQKNEIDKELLYNLLTVNTIFAGFTYNMLGNMVEFSSREDIQELDLAGYVDDYFSPMYFSLFYFIFSIFIELILIFFGIKWQLNLLVYIQQVGTALGLTFFVVSTLKMKRMINKVRKK